jgi:hypothetical protein
LTSSGIKSYNLAIGGSSVRTNYVQLDEYLTNYRKRPKYVLLGLNSDMVRTFDDEGIHPIVEWTMKDHVFRIKDIPILKFKWLGTEFLKKIISEKHRNAKLSYGQVKFQKTNSDNTNSRESYFNTIEMESSHWIGEIARLCGRNGIELIVMEMPGYKVTRNVSGIGPYKLHFNNGSSSLLYNFNSQEFCAIFDANKDWIGNSHLNEFGAFKFTEKLIKILQP